MLVQSWAEQQAGLAPGEIYENFKKFDWQSALLKNMNEILEGLSMDLFQKNPFLATSNEGATLHHSKDFSILLCIQQRPRQDRDFLDAQAAHQFWRVIGPGTVGISRYAYPPGYTNASFDPGIQLLPPVHSVLQNGDSLWIDPDQQLLRVNQCNDMMMIVKLIFPSHAQLVWHFDKHTLRARECSAADLCASRAILMLQWLQKIPGDAIEDSTLDWLMRLSRDAPFYVRWEAVRTMLLHRKSLGLELARERLRDEHPEVVEAAQSALLLFEEPCATGRGG